MCGLFGLVMASAAHHSGVEAGATLSLRVGGTWAARSPMGRVDNPLPPWLPPQLQLKSHVQLPSSSLALELHLVQVHPMVGALMQSACYWVAGLALEREWPRDGNDAHHAGVVAGAMLSRFVWAALGSLARLFAVRSPSGGGSGL